jgi:hypothetical protein
LGRNDRAAKITEHILDINFDPWQMRAILARRKQFHFPAPPFLTSNHAKNWKIQNLQPAIAPNWAEQQPIRYFIANT